MIAATSPTASATLLATLLGLAPARRLAVLRSTGEPTTVLVSLGDEAERLAAVEVAAALATTAAIVPLADEWGAPLGRARARRARAAALAAGSRFDEALAVCQDGTAIATAAGEMLEVARLGLRLVQAFSGLGRYDEAIAAGQTARETFVAAAEPGLAARADVNLGAVHDMRDDPGRALTHYDRARPALLHEPTVLAQLDANRGTALMALDDFAGAEKAFVSAVAAFEAAGLAWAAAIAEGNLAYLATRQGHLERAFAHFERARRDLEADEAPADLVRLAAERADTIALLGLPSEAATTYEQLLPRLDALGFAAEAAAARSSLGAALLRIGRHEEAERVLAEASTAFSRLGMGPSRARVDLLRAEAAAVAGRPDEARILLLDALGELGDRPVDAIPGHYQLARLALADGDLVTAEAELATAVAVAQRLGLSPTLADLLHLRAAVERRRGHPDRALTDLRAALDQVERVRGALPVERFRAAFLGNRLAIYEGFVVQALDQGGAAAIAEAFAAVEGAKSRALLDQIAGALDLEEAADRASDDPIEAALLVELAQIQAELNWLYGGLDPSKESGPTPIGDRQVAIRERETALDALRDRLAAGRGVAALFAAPIGLESARAVVPVGGALVEYFLAEDELVAFVLRGGFGGADVAGGDTPAVQVCRGLATKDELANAARRVLFQIGRAIRPGAATTASRAEQLLTDARRELAALYDMVIAPLEAALVGCARLIVIPHGPLHAIPFQALWDRRRERYLIEDVELHYAPSASLLARLGGDGEAPPTGEASALVVGVADALAPRIADEAVRVAEVLGCRPVLGQAASVEAVIAAAEQATIVHLACHGRFSAENPAASGLRLGDRWLTAREIYRLRLSATLVTLSGCDTGRAVVGNGDELVGLIRGFFAAGASSLLMSLWLVNDESTADLMTRFYRGWREGASKGGALRSAQLALLAERPHPAFWAPFVLGGLS